MATTLFSKPVSENEVSHITDQSAARVIITKRRGSKEGSGSCRIAQKTKAYDAFAILAAPSVFGLVIYTNGSSQFYSAMMANGSSSSASITGSKLTITIYCSEKWQGLYWESIVQSNYSIA